MANAKEAPGPGAYTIGDRKEGPQYSMGSKTERKSTEENPGPGMYLAASHGTGPTAKIGTERRGKAKKVENPGPGNYDNRSSLAGPKWGFGTSKKSDPRKSDDFGMLYNVPASIPNVATYALTQKNSKFSLD
jgi:hypothetical protein